MNNKSGSFEFHTKSNCRKTEQLSLSASCRYVCIPLLVKAVHSRVPIEDEKFRTNFITNKNLGRHISGGTTVSIETQ